MNALDFEYDGQRLSDYGFIICNFGSSSMNTVSAGSSITFNKISLHGGKRYGLTSTKYDECIQTTFSICKDPRACSASKLIDNKFNNLVALGDILLTTETGEMEVSNREFRDLFRWLNRREFLKFRLIFGDDYDGDICYYEASFNVSKVMIAETLYGLELTMETNRPFGFGEEEVVSWTVSDTKKSQTVIDKSDEIGSLYPYLEIIPYQNGDLTLYNDLENCTMEIRNCIKGERIILYGDTQIITSSVNSHHIYDDFNYEFFRIGNTITNRNNNIRCTIQAKITLKYRPIIKDAF